MVSGTRCPAWSDKLKKWSEGGAAAPRGRCPVGHRGEFPYVRPSVRTYVRPSVRPPPGHSGPNLALSGLKLVL